MLVALALVHRPPVIVLDEPTAGVDVELRQSLWAFIRRLNGEGHTVVLTTHYLEEAQALCTRIGMLNRGRLIALDSTRELLRRVAGVRVTLRLRGALPTTLQPQVIEHDAPRYVLRLAQATDVETALATCRAEGAEIEDLEVGHADLEDVFLQLLQEHRDAGAAA